MNNKRKLLSIGMAFGLTVAATAAHATATQDTWKLEYYNVPGVGNGGYASNTTISGANTPYTYQSQNSSHQATATGIHEDTYGGTLVDSSQDLRHWSGLSFDRGYGDGVDGNDSHTVDNYGYDEIVVFEFEEAISLQSFKFGYVGADGNRTDSDTTILYHDTTQNIDNNLVGASFSTTSLAQRGWTALAHIANVGTSVRDISSLTAGTYSKTWAIGAFLNNVSALNVVGSHYLGGGNDGFKLAAITGITHGGGQVPISGTHLLLVLGIALMFFSRSGVVGRK